jgi:hypothetical protein
LEVLMREYTKTPGGAGGNTQAKRAARGAAARADKKVKLTPRYSAPEDGCPACPSEPSEPKKVTIGTRIPCDGRRDKEFAKEESRPAVINCGPLPLLPPGRTGNDPRHSGR